MSESSNNIYFSLLCPTRGRPQGIVRLLDSAMHTIKDKSRVEIVFCCDVDDSVSNKQVAHCIHTYPSLNIRLFVRGRSEYLNRDYYNFMADRALGEFVWAVGDDVVLLTKDWDEILYNNIVNAYSKQKDRVLYVSIDDSTPVPNPGDPPFCCFPLISKEAIKALGFFLSPSIPTWGADQTVFTVYNHPDINRVLVVWDVIVDHICRHNNKVVPDMTNKHVEAVYKKYPGAFTYCMEKEVPTHINILKDYLRRVNE